MPDPDRVKMLQTLLDKVRNPSPVYQDFLHDCKAVRQTLTASETRVLFQLVTEGPVWDGNIVSKANRDTLIAIGLASRACVKNEQGYTVANYLGWNVLKLGGAVE